MPQLTIAQEMAPTLRRALRAYQKKAAADQNRLWNDPGDLRYLASRAKLEYEYAQKLLRDLDEVSKGQGDDEN